MTDLFPRGRLLVFCKAPRPGSVKTRLIPALGAVGAAELHRELATGVLHMVQQAHLAPVQLWCAPDTTDSFFTATGLPLYCQQGEDLGARMAQAFATALADPAVDYALLIGTDCANLDVAYLQAAFQQLQAADAVLGPAEDGGYGLIGLRQAAPAVFRNIAWSTDTVCAATAAHLNRVYRHWALLPLLWDVDRPDDLARLMSMGRR
jgi:rSAM/selenodomain-associated transferase 1